jgi:thiamine-monophosphate kinase
MPESSPALSEFDLIRRYFTRPVHKAALGVGDDCALIEARPGHQLAISTDMLVSGRHFFPDVSPRALGHKALAVNLSDLAAMGAEPAHSRWRWRCPRRMQAGLPNSRPACWRWPTTTAAN